MGEIRIVIADLDAQRRKSLKAILTQVGHLVVGEAGNALEALKLVRTRQPDLVILDAKMGMMDSAELAYVIEEDRLAPVIMITPGDYFKTHGQNGEPKPFAYIIEPVTERNLLPIIDVVIKNFKRIRNLEQEIDMLKRAIETRKLVEKAKGILMDTYKISEAEAFRRIQKQSMNKRISMKSVAKAIILTHEINR